MRTLNLTPTQEKALATIRIHREVERKAIEQERARMWDRIEAGPRRKVAEAVRDALALGISKRQIRLALGNKNEAALEPYLGMEE